MATTINAYKVSLSLDAWQYISASSLSRSETSRLKKEIEGARSPAEQYTLSLNRLDKALKDGAISQGTHTRLVASAKDQFKAATTSADGFAESIAGIAAGYLSLSSAKEFLKDSVKIAAAAETAAIQFEVLSGSVAESARLVKGLQNLAATTPLTLADTQAAARTLLSFGMASESILPTLKMLGDVTGGNADRFKMLSLAYAQTTAAGRLMGQDLLQMVNAGFNPLQQISKTTGESLLELKKRMESGAISSQEMTEAFRAATSEGGRFFGMIDRVATTTEGKLAKLLDSIYELKKAVGESSSPLVNAFADVAEPTLDKFTAGFKVLSTGYVYGIVQQEQKAMEKIREQQKWADRQAVLRRGGFPGFRTESSLALDKQPAGETSTSIESFLGSSISAIESMSSTVLNGLSTFQQAAESIAMVGVANTQELVKSMKEDPAITNLQEGTQEAYEYLTRATREADQRGRLESIRKQQLDENAAKQRDTMNKYLDRINTALENSGFKRIR